MSASSQIERSVADVRLRLVHRIVASPGFVRSARLSEFLLYVCERALDGRTDEISEHQIGVRVFKRAPNYNPNDDSIVRSHARLLRRKLDSWFEQEGRGEEYRVQIPKGRYVPVFEHRNTHDVKEGAYTAVIEPVASHLARFRWIWVCAVLCAVSLLVLVAVRMTGSESRARSVPHAFWKGFFSSGKKILIVPADSALALIEDLTHQRVHLPDYLNRKYRLGLKGGPALNGPTLSNIADRQYTSMADLNLTARLVRLPEAGARQIEIRYARKLQLADLKEGSAVLIGGPRANPWEDLFQDKMNFSVDSDPVTSENGISNKSPRSGESGMYREQRADSSFRAYGLVAFLPGLNPATHILVVEGTSSIGTECAADFLLDDISLGAFIGKVSPGGGKPAYFEVLLQTATVDGNAQQPQIVAYRIIKD